MNDDQKQALLSILSQNQLCVLSTISGNQAQSALVAFAEDDDCNLYIQTRNSSRKAENLAKNPHTSLVIGWDLDDLKNLQYEGKTQLITDQELIKNVKQMFLAKKSPSTDKYLEHPETQFYKITPSWVRYSDYKTPLIWEVELC